RRTTYSCAVGLTLPAEPEDSPDSTPPERPLRSMHTGQNSIASENSLPQLGQVRRGSVLMALLWCVSSPPKSVVSSFSSFVEQRSCHFSGLKGSRDPIDHSGKTFPLGALCPLLGWTRQPPIRHVSS